MIKRTRLDFILPAAIFFVLLDIILTLYSISIDTQKNIVKSAILNTGELISKEFKNIVSTDIHSLENIKKRIELTDGTYYENFENDASLILEQNTSFKFIEWIDSSMVVRKIYPLRDYGKSLNLDISKSKIDKRSDRINEWIEHSKNGLTNITPWLYLTENNYAFLVDVPVYFNDEFQGTISAGMDFKVRFNRLVEYLENQYTIELRDDKGVLFYEINKDIKLNTDNSVVFKNNIIIDGNDNQAWNLRVFPSENLLIAKGESIINMALIGGLLLTLITTLLIYFFLRAEKASQAKTEFLSNMSHEIRTPLHAITGLIQILKTSKLNDADKEYVDLMDKSSNNLLNLVNDILEIDKIESGNPELENTIFCPSEKVKELIDVSQFLFLKKNLYLKAHFENTLGLNVLADQTKFLRVLNNILKNALKFTEKGGAIFTYNETILKDKLKLNICIEDTGIGIPYDKINYIFNRFTQIDSSIKKQYEGSGLGLAISKDLVSLMQGNITVTSEVNEGSKFHISLSFPIAEKQENIMISQIKKEINFSALNVLIVDDNNLNIIVLKKFLEGIGIRSDTAENGKIGLQKVENKNYQLIFMDIHMPEIDGWEATKIIRETNKEVIILGLSANVTKEAITKAKESGMNDYLTKPFKKEQLFKMLQFYFKREDEDVKTSA